MFESLKWILSKQDTPPGSLVYAGDDKEFVPYAIIRSYDAENMIEKRCADVHDVVLEKGCVNFIHVVGVHQAELVQGLGKMLDFPLLALEDVMNTGQRPKYVSIDDETDFVVMKNTDVVDRQLVREQVSLFWRDGLVVFFSENENDLLDGIGARLNRKKGRIRQADSSYLVATILDALVDRQLKALAELGEAAVDLEAELLEKTTDDRLEQLYKIKRETILFRNLLMPIRDIFKSLLLEDAEFSKEVLPYLHDVAGHSDQAVEGAYALHDILKSMIDYQISLIGMKTNKVMQFLTVIATVFIPLTFIAGVYGMNFQYMPELQWRYGYFIALGIMGIIGGIMFVFFLKRKII
ncbi:magnesium/cobalt transporter CorA [uncultured Pseudodesulfovibrio sp.]|uniref:magnesium/cobalt transporter CorA n=1 Tax=uncultured Pseudodesulfovibrio sp. TaxID=2035858 RepID=UPI0029C64D88|nr:magnesium/cobalt transporter CorA [uncultured Pseudodesulfovibrio sp.]